jgi:hypothetical protein
MNRHNLPFKDQSILLLAIAQTLVWAGFYYLFPALLLRWEQSLGWSKTDLTAAITLAIFVIWLSLVSSLFEFYFIWALIGVVMAGCLFEPCFALITRAKGEKAKQSIILVTLMVGFASTLCYPGIYTLSETYGWRSAVQFFAAVLISIATPLMWFGAQPFEQEGKANARLNNIHSLRNRYSGFWHWPLLCWQLSTVSSFITCFQFSPTGALMRIPQS